MQPHHRTMIGVALFAFAAFLAGLGAMILSRAMKRKRAGDRHGAHSLVMGAFALFVGSYIILRVAIGAVSEG